MVTANTAQSLKKHREAAYKQDVYRKENKLQNYLDSNNKKKVIFNISAVFSASTLILKKVQFMASASPFKQNLHPKTHSV